MNFTEYDVTVYDDVIYWRFNRNLHRNRFPAVECSNGDKRWYQNGHLHRIGLPAVEYANNTKEWWKKGLPHRLDGPAIDSKLWVNGKHYHLKSEYNKAVTDYLADVHNGPYINNSRDKYWPPNVIINNIEYKLVTV